MWLRFERRFRIVRRLFFAVFLSAAGAVGLASEDFSLPSDASDFRWCALGARSGIPWFAVWDLGLDVPYLAFPEEPVPIGAVGPESSPLDLSKIAEAVDRFIEENPDLFGVGLGSLSAREILRSGGDYHVSAVQLSGGLPVRGSSLRLRLDSRGRLLSLHATLARDLPPLSPAGAFDTKSWDRRAREEDSLLEVVSVLPQVVFPQGMGSATAAAVIAGITAGGREVEIFYDLASGERIAKRTTDLSFGDGDSKCEEAIEVYGDLLGYCPDPRDPHRLPAHYDPERELYPLPDVCLSLEAEGSCPAFLRRYAEGDGTFRLFLNRLSPEAPYEVSARLSNGKFAIVSGLRDCYLRTLRGSGSVQWSHTYNSEGSEFEAFHLLVYHHLRRATSYAAKLSEAHALPYRWRAFPGNAVMLERSFYAARYLPHSGYIVLANDEVLEEDEVRRWRKIVPTIVYHEYGHEFAVALSGSSSDEGVHDGVADAFAAYVSGSSRLGGASDESFVSWEGARDLRSDAIAYPGDPRRAVAGAFWELWETTLDAPGGDGPPRSSFAEGLLARWLASRWTCLGVACAPKGLRWSPYLGVELYLESGFEHERELIEAFGKRNLFPYPFRRGDANSDGRLDLADAVSVLNYLFLGGPESSCPDALDADDDGKLDLTDAVSILGHLFLGAGSLPEPFDLCGLDPTLEDGLGCWESSCRFIRAAR